MKKFLFSLAFVFAGVAATAQTAATANLQQPVPVSTQPQAKQNAAPKKAVDRPVDGYYKKRNAVTSIPVPYAEVREADIFFSKRIWREIDLREKLNAAFASPRARLIEIIVDAIKVEDLTAYDATPHPELNDPNGDTFSIPLTPLQAIAKLSDSTFVEEYDSLGNKIPGSGRMEFNDYDPETTVTAFRIKEDWIFDKQRSVFEPRIVGIAPLVKIKKQGVSDLNLEQQPAFWIYFPEARIVFAKKTVVDRFNDATQLTYDDVFMKRLFSSYIVKESNVKDESIKDYIKTNGIDRLNESERIKRALMDWEHDLWSY